MTPRVPAGMHQASTPLDKSQLLKPVKKLRKLIHKLDEQATPKTVHALRTNVRRVQAIFTVLPLASPKSLHKNLDDLHKRAGKVRDMDVLTSFASTVHIPGEEECAIQLLEHLGAKRKKYAKKLLASPSLPKLLKRLALNIKNNRDATDIVSELAGGLTSGPRLSRTTLHSYRLKIKELGNVLRLAGQPSTLLDSVKDAIGEWHDWDQLVSIAQKVINHPRGCRLLKKLLSIAAEKYRRALSQSQQLKKRDIMVD